MVASSALTVVLPVAPASKIFLTAVFSPFGRTWRHQTNPENTPRAFARGVFFCVLFLVGSVLGSGFLGSALLAGVAQAAAMSSTDVGNCPLPATVAASAVDTVRIRSVYDGDTLTTADGRKVRLVGVNAPELGRDGKGDEPLARQAKSAVESFVKGSAVLTLVYDRERRDHYGRHLAHVYNASGQNLAALLLSRGLASHIAVPPNLLLADCLAAVEKQARQRRAGLWGASGDVIDASRVSAGGYQRVQGRVESVVFARAWWINLDGVLAGVIYPEHQQRFSRQQLRALEGKRVELQGWVYPSRNNPSHTTKTKPWRVKIETPYALGWPASTTH